MRLVLALVVTGVVAGCGADGAPERPKAASGVTVSGEARVGVVLCDGKKC
ncbi:MAG: argininosuccinate lyase [Rhodobacteraceae bacterium]|jgi:hypothetical protein|nr:argininosuccinate lyase [Paracoccaceae bacterium]